MEKLGLSIRRFPGFSDYRHLAWTTLEFYYPRDHPRPWLSTMNFLPRRSRIKLAKKLPAGLVLRLSRIITFLFFCFSLIFFYAETSNQSTHFVSNLFASLDPDLLISNFRDMVVGAYRKDFFLALINPCHLDDFRILPGDGK